MELNKDFYIRANDDIICYLEQYIEKYGKCDWFNEFWNRYREHVLTEKKLIRYPQVYLSDYVEVRFFRHHKWSDEHFGL